MKKCYIMRGLPGAGKSTWAQRHICESKGITLATVSADQYHYGPITTDPVIGLLQQPKYQFKQENVKAAHDKCLLDFLALLHQSIWQEIIVDNTNTTAWEIAPYYRLAEVLGYEVEIVWLQCWIKDSVARNVHNVPEDTIRKMNMRMEREALPPHWKQRIVLTRTPVE